MAWRYLDLVDYLLIAEATLGIDAERLARLDRLGLADSALNAPAAGFGEVEAYPDFETKVAVLGWHLIKNHPLPDGNKRIALLAMIEFARRNGWTWTPDPGDPSASDAIIRSAASGTADQNEFARWVRQRLSEL
ncbi:MAG TPA: Fic family protein [Solirubrobacterales bacterium]|jgi:death-on-curing protein|nr:Fic family protein [Solirubrobacterales bacterium]